MSEEEESAKNEFEIVLKKMKELEEEIEKLREMGMDQTQKEKLLTELRNFMTAAQGENVFNIRISPSLRGAIFKLKRGVYALLNKTRKEDPNFDMDASKENWTKIAQKIVEESNAKGVSNYPAKIIMTYEFVEKDGKKVFKPKEARIIIFEPKDLFTIPMPE